MYVPWGLIDHKSALVQIIAWRRSGDKPLSESMLCLLFSSQVFLLWNSFSTEYFVLLYSINILKTLYFYIDHNKFTAKRSVLMVYYWSSWTVYTFRSLYCIYQLLQKHSIATITQLRSLELLTAKTPLLHMLYYMNWLTHDFWTRTGGWEFDRSHGAGTSSPSHWQQVEEQAPKPVGWMMCFLLMTFVPPIQKLCVNIYIYIYIYICSSIWVLFSLVYQFCLALW